MSNDLVSVIVPTFNRADCILETLETLRAQTHTHWELVLVDDGSTDATRDLVTRFFDGDSRLRYIYQQNAGVSHARNTGLKAAKGDFIAFLDSDDLWKPWKLEAQLACMRAYPHVGMVWTDMETISADGTPLSERHLRTMYSAYRYHRMDRLFHDSTAAQDIAGIPPAALEQDSEPRFYYGDIYTAMILGSLVHTSTVLLRRERALQVGGFDEGLKHSGEDYDFHLRTCSFGPVGLLDVSAIKYRKHREDRLTRHTDATAVNFLATIEKAIRSDTAGRLPAASLKQVLAEANGWVAEEKFKLGDNHGTRRHALRSLRRNPRTVRLALLVALSLLPVTLRLRAVDAYRSLKRRLRSS